MAEARVPQLKLSAKEAKETFTPIPMAVSAELSKKIRQSFVWPPEKLTIDDTGTYATDGRENLPVSYELTRSLLSKFSTDGKGRVWEAIAPIKVTICGTDESYKLVVLNGRQRIKAILFLNRVIEKIHKMYVALDCNQIRTLNAVNEAASEASKTGDEDFAWITPEDADRICGGEVNGVMLAGFLHKTKDSPPEDGPLPYHVRVEYSSIDPNSPDALEISLAERISVDTPPSVQAKQIRRLLDAGRSDASIAVCLGRDIKTLYNKLLISILEPEVQSAIDNKIVSWNTAVEQFFIKRDRHDPKAKSPEEQLKILSTMVDTNSGTGKMGKILRQKLVDKGVLKAPVEPKHEQVHYEPHAPEVVKTTVTCNACGVELDGTNSSTLPNGAVKHVTGCTKEGYVTMPPPAPVAPPRNTTGTAPAPVSPALVAKPTPAKKAESPFQNLAVTARVLQERADALEDSDSRYPLQAVAAMLSYLAGDGTALDRMPGIKDYIIDAMAQAMEISRAEAATPVVAKAQEQTPRQKLAANLVTILSDWDGFDPSTPWPTFDEDSSVWPKTPEECLACSEQIERMEQEYKDLNDEDVDRSDFAQSWVIKNVLGTELTF